MQTAKEKVFIAGATGAIGMPLTRALIAKGYTVIGLTRSPEKRARIEQLGAAAVVADALDAAALSSALQSTRPDWVVDLLTALPKTAPTRYAHLTATNVLRTKGTENLLKASIAAGVKRIVGESMIFVYGFGDHGAVAKVESDPLRPQAGNPALRMVVDALRSLESQLLTANQQGLIETIALRYGLFYGPGNPSTRYMLNMVNKRLFPAFSGSQGILSWVQLGDAVDATLAAVENGRAGEIYNIVDDHPVSLNAWVQYAAQQLGAKPPFTIPLGLAKVIMPYVAEFSSTRLLVSNAKAKRELHWQPQFASYQKGIREIIGRSTA